MILVVPPSSKFLSAFWVAVVAEDSESWEELLELHFPIQDDARRNDDQMWSPYPSIRGEVSQQSDRLNSLAETWRSFANVSGLVLMGDVMTYPSHLREYN